MATIKLGMDASEVISKQEQINQGAKQHGEHAKNFGEQMAHAAEHGLSRALLKVVAIREALTAAIKAAQKISEANADANKKRGGEALAMGSDLRSLGIKEVGGLEQALKNTEGASTIEERQEFIKKLAATNRQRRVKFSQKEVTQALFKFAKGGATSFGEGGEDLIKNMERRRPIKTDAQIDQDLANLTPEEREEIANRNFERQQELRKEGAFEGDKGTRARRAQALAEAKHAEQMNGKYGLLSETAREATSSVLGTDVAGAAIQQGLEKQTDQLGLIESNTRGKPRLNYANGNGP